MRKLLLFVLVSTLAFGQTSNVQKSTPTQRLTAGFKVPSGQTLQFESGSTLLIDSGAITSLLIDPTTTPGDMIFRNALGVLDRLPIGATGKGMVVSSGLPVWSDVAPLAANYVTLTANSTLTGEFSLGSLTTGLLLNTVSGGTATITKAVAGTDYVAPGATTTSGLTMATAKLLGRSTASTGGIEEITVGSGLTLSAGSLTASGGSGTGANPTASVGLSAVNGSASTLIRSDGAPPLSQSIAPTWTAQHIFNANAQGGSNPALKLTDSNSSEPLWLRVEQTSLTSSFELGVAGADGQFLSDVHTGDGIFKGFGAGSPGMAFGGGPTSPSVTLYLKWGSSGAGRVLVATATDDGSNALQVNGTARIGTKTPSSASDTGVTGTVCWDASFFYVCTATNTWKRASLATW